MEPEPKERSLAHYVMAQAFDYVLMKIHLKDVKGGFPYDKEPLFTKIIGKGITVVIYYIRSTMAHMVARNQSVNSRQGAEDFLKELIKRRMAKMTCRYEINNILLESIAMSVEIFMFMWIARDIKVQLPAPYVTWCRVYDECMSSYFTTEEEFQELDMFCCNNYLKRDLHIELFFFQMKAAWYLEFTIYEDVAEIYYDYVKKFMRLYLLPSDEITVDLSTCDRVIIPGKKMSKNVKKKMKRGEYVNLAKYESIRTKEQLVKYIHFRFDENGKDYSFLVTLDPQFQLDDKTKERYKKMNRPENLPNPAQQVKVTCWMQCPDNDHHHHYHYHHEEGHDDHHEEDLGDDHEERLDDDHEEGLEDDHSDGLEDDHDGGQAASCSIRRTPAVVEMDWESLNSQQNELRERTLGSQRTKLNYRQRYHLKKRELLSRRDPVPEPPKEESPERPPADPLRGEVVPGFDIY